MDGTLEEMQISRSLWNSSVSYISDNPGINTHRHYSYKVAVSLDHSIDCQVAGKVRNGLKGFIVNRGMLHKCVAPGGPILNNLVEPSSAWGRKLEQILDGQEFIRLEEIVNTSRIDPILPKNYQSLTNEALYPHIFNLFHHITRHQQIDIKPLDSRISSVLQYVDSHLEKDLFLENVVDQTFLSTERTRHLFAEQMGIPFSKYVLWQRMRKTLYHIILNKSTLSQTVTSYGFTDLSHFNRLFKAIFGFNPSTFLKECRVIV